MWSGYLLYLPWRCRASQFWWEISVIFLSQAWQAMNTLRLLRNLSIRALTSFSGFSSSVGPCTDFNYFLASLKIVVGVVAKWVLPLKYLTFRFWNSYVVPFFTLLMDSSQMWITAVPVLSSNTQPSLTSVIFSVDFTSTGLGSSLPTEMVAVTCHMTFWFIFGVGTCPRVIVTAGCTEKENDSDEATSEK